MAYIIDSDKLNTALKTIVNELKTEIAKGGVYGTCSTAAGTAAKVVPCTCFKLVPGAHICVKFTVTNTAASPTMNVGGTGAKAIQYRGAAITAGYLAANRTYMFVYDGTNYQLVGDIDTNTTYSAATTSANGLMTSTMVTKLNGIATSANNYSLPTASASTLGGIKVGTNLSIASGVLSATNTTYSNFVKSGTGAAAGLVPSPGTTAGTTKFLREDATWVVPTNTTYSNMTAATASAAGKAGLVPAPAAGKQTAFLRGDATWVVPTNTTYSNMTAATASAAGKAGLVPAPAAGKQTSFLRGDGTWVVPTNTTYSNFVKSGTGAAAGLVPSPGTTAGTTKFLREDATWQVPTDTNTDTKVTNTLGTTTKFYVTGTSSATTNTGTQYFDTGVYVSATAGNFYATTMNTGGNLVMGGTSGTSYLQLPSGIKLY